MSTVESMYVAGHAGIPDSIDAEAAAKRLREARAGAEVTASTQVYGDAGHGDVKAGG